MHMHRTNTLSRPQSKRVAAVKEEIQKPLSNSAEDSTTVEPK